MTVHSVGFQFTVSGEKEVAAAFASIKSAATGSAKPVNALAKALGKFDEASDKMSKDVDKTLSKIGSTADQSATKLANATEKMKTEAKKDLTEIRNEAKKTKKSLEDVSSGGSKVARGGRNRGGGGSLRGYVNLGGGIGIAGALPGSLPSLGAGKAIQMAHKAVAFTGAAGLGGLARSAGENFSGIGGMIENSIANVMSTSDMANSIARQMGHSGQRAGDPQAIEAQLYKIASSVGGGTSGSDIGKIVQTFMTKTGNMGAAMQMAGAVQTAALAGGVDPDDMAAAGTQLLEKFNIRDVEQFKQALADALELGKKGAFEIKDMASQYERLAAAGQTYGMGEDVNSAKQLNTLAQLARQTTGSPEMATTAIENMFTQLLKKAGPGGAISELGVNVMDGTKGRDIFQVLPELISGAFKAKGTGGVGELMQIMDARGFRAISGLVNEFGDAFTSAGGVNNQVAALAAGTKAVNDKIMALHQSTTDFSKVQSDAAIAGQSNAALWKELTSALDVSMSGLVKEFNKDGTLGNALKSFAADLTLLAKSLLFVFKPVIAAYNFAHQGVGVEPVGTPESLATESADSKKAQLAYEYLTAFESGTAGGTEHDTSANAGFFADELRTLFDAGDMKGFFDYVKSIGDTNGFSMENGQSLTDALATVNQEYITAMGTLETSLDNLRKKMNTDFRFRMYGD